MAEYLNYGDMEDRERARCVNVLQTIAVNIPNNRLPDIEFREFVLNSISTIPQMLLSYESSKKKFDITSPDAKQFAVTIEGKSEIVIVSRAAVFYLLDAIDRQLEPEMAFNHGEYQDMFTAVYNNAPIAVMEDCYVLTHTVAHATLLRKAINFSVA